MTRETQNPAGGRGSGKAAALVSAHRQYSASPLDRILCGLAHVRKAGRGYTARCPAHEDRTASLSVSEAPDGRVLLHCFAGCGAGDVVAALGLRLGDLFPRRDLADLTREDRHAMREGARMAHWKAALAVLGREANVVGAAAAMVASGPLGPEGLARLLLATSRIDDALAVLQ